MGARICEFGRISWVLLYLDLGRLGAILWLAATVITFLVQLMVQRNFSTNAG